MFRVTTLDLAAPPRNPDGGVDYRRDFFGRPASLSVSGQLEAETYACGLGPVYTFGPTFRAENSNTRRHLAEFWMVEPEVPFATLDDDAALAVDLLRHLFRAVCENAGDDLAFFDERYERGLAARLAALAGAKFERMAYTEAVRALENSGEAFEFPAKWGMDLQTEHERWLVEKHCGSPLIVTDYPREIKAFYMRRNDDGKTVAAMDVLLPGVGEIIGGSQREERLGMLLDAMAAHNLKPADYGWYLDLRRFGTVPHAGFGLGFERLMLFCTGLPNIRDTIPYPRAPGLCQ
jgi:asparaginyl-tRNA synthetase